MLDLAQTGLATDRLEQRRVLAAAAAAAAALHDQQRMIDEPADMLQRLEDVLLTLAAVATVQLTALRAREVVVETLLERRELAIVVLDDLGRQIGKHVLLEPTEDEREHLLVQRLEGQRACTMSAQLSVRLNEPASCSLDDVLALRLAAIGLL